jgi:Flp pilus assembly pilin Flp
MNAIKNFLVREDGQDLVEYALLAALLSIASITALKILGPKISATWDKISAEL